MTVVGSSVRSARAVQELSLRSDAAPAGLLSVRLLTRAARMVNSRLPVCPKRLPHFAKPVLSQRRLFATPTSSATPPPPPAVSPPARRTYFDLALIGGGGAALVGLLIWAKGKRDSEAEMGQKEGQRGSFTVPVLSQSVARRAPSSSSPTSDAHNHSLSPRRRHW